ncbi:DUF6691 family protein [Schleiferia thermophila]|jgi:uncharacterized membrane protein YedE/YeeE|uniref:Uncharacterized protein n=1 Tax=Schleiferia thermophila TaxID=884107 RepID=A0A368ZZK4_9FLAO|nr:DUF6691 family protein [Schleiferia thermophila]KFD39024.1 transporter [Schleiferia thermophila str. Yellowstone]RCX02385.1 hypothetical protein DES35_104145 [Schleiferia thermophila]GCD80731.1 transporter [Schleiferia thermophila]
MKLVRFVLVGILFGIIMAKSEAISWYRIYEMFHFDAFHMYGIIGTAVTIGAIGVFLIKKFKLRDFHGNPIVFFPKDKTYKRYIFGGTLFGLGWALAGSCPGPIVVNIGYGYSAYLIVLVFAVIGTYLYGLLMDKLPH